MPNPLSPQDLRKHIKQQRMRLSESESQRLSQAAVQHLSRQRFFKTARNIAIYLPVRGEADPRDLLEYSHPQQHFFLPVLSLSHNSHLIFVEWNQHTKFRKNRFNIPEPLLARQRILNARQLDLVITPLVAFDRQGSRLGMGGGFYDRSFAAKLYLKHPQPLLVGFAYPFQEVEYLERQVWDVPLDASCTALGLKPY